MLWYGISIQRAKNGFVICIRYHNSPSDTFVLEGDEKKLAEVLYSVLTGEDHEDSGT